MVRRRRRRGKLKLVKSVLTFLVTFFLVTVVGLIAYSMLMDRPQDLPWTELKLDQPVGFFTGQKLAGLEGEYQKCQGLLDQAGVAYQPFPPVGQNQCRRDENISLLSQGAGRISFNPSVLAPSCPVVAALTIWENQVVQPAAIEHFDQKIAQIRHLGSLAVVPSQAQKIGANTRLPMPSISLALYLKTGRTSRLSIIGMAITLRPIS